METKKKTYTEESQRLLMSYMISDPESFTRSQIIIQPEYFSNKLRSSIRYIKDYSESYNILPTPAQIKAQTGVDIALHTVQPQHAEWYLTEIEQFCRHRALENLILGGTELLEQGLYGEVEQRVKDAMLISLQRDLGTNYFADPKARLTNMRQHNTLISTGWKVLDDKLYGGLGRGTLNIWLGQSGAGKSLVLQNLALNYIGGGYNVVYFSLELSEDLVAMRMDAMLSGMGTKEIYKKLDEVDLKVRMYGKNGSRLQLVKMPSGSTTNTIKAYLKEYEIQTNVRPEVIVVDYLDLMSPISAKIDPTNLFVKDKYVSEELRDLAGEFDAIVISAAQMNRGSHEVEEYTHANVAGGISKINSCDTCFAIRATFALRERGAYEFQFLKTRTSTGVGSKIELAFDPVTMRMTDPEPQDVTTPRSREDIAQSLKRHVTSEASNGSAALRESMNQVRRIGGL